MQVHFSNKAEGPGVNPSWRARCCVSPGFGRHSRCSVGAGGRRPTIIVSGFAFADRRQFVAARKNHSELSVLRLLDFTAPGLIVTRFPSTIIER